MKKYIFIALAAIAALSSCTKDNLVSQENNGREAQVFTATMEDGIATKVTFDGTNKCAFWEVGDVISIDGHNYTANQAGASSTFTGSGATESTHHAYFPADIYNGGTPTLPAELTYAEGKFNMPMYAESSTMDLSFKNLCAVLAITVDNDNLVSTSTTSLKAIKIKSDKRMHGAFSATAGGVLSFASTAIPTDDEKTVTLTMSSGVDISSSKIFYIAIPAQDYSYLKIYLSADGSTYKEAMITQKAAGLGTIARSTMFNITYKTNAVQVYANGPYWATCNIGATVPTDYGWYFSWGNTTGYVHNGTYWVEALGNTKKLGADGSFSDGNYNGTSGFSCSGNIPVNATNDAAYANWGAAWRMPTQAEFDALTSVVGSAWDGTGTVKGYRFGTSPNQIFLPAAGCGDGTDLYTAGIYGYYWSSSLDTGSPSFAYNLSFYDGSAYTDYYNRYSGYSVRALSE